MPATGSPGWGSYTDVTWVWNGKDWSRHDVAMFGGQGEEGRLGDTWVWDGDAWTEQHASPSPSKRTGHAMASTPFKAVLFGGGNDDGAETWEWDGKTWSQREVPGPPVPFGHRYGQLASQGTALRRTARRGQQPRVLQRYLGVGRKPMDQARRGWPAARRDQPAHGGSLSLLDEHDVVTVFAQR